MTSKRASAPGPHNGLPLPGTSAGPHRASRADPGPSDAALLHELQVHQVELEAQNHELRRTQVALEAARDRYADLFDFAPVGYLTVAGDGVVMEANLPGAALLGATRQTLLGVRFASLVAPEDLARWQAVVRRVLGGNERLGCDLTMRRVTGDAFRGRLDCAHMKVDQHPGVRVVLADVTERLRVEEELRTRQRLDSLALLAGGIAHDFNNLLTSLFGHVEAARAVVPEGGEADQDLSVALSALDRARGLTRQLLLFSGGSVLQRKALSVPKLVADAVAIGLGGSSIRARVDLPAGLPQVDADEGRASQLLDNLLLNARQAMPRGGEVLVSARRRTVAAAEEAAVASGEFVEISIRDHGPGIPRDVLPRIFDPFFSTREGGRGLGLAVCRSIAVEHGGSIGVRSEEGVGTTFTVLLPAAVGQPLAPPPPAAPDPAPLARRRVLLMDDEPMLRRVGTKHLHALGCVVDTAADGEEAIAMFRRARAEDSPYAAVILDLTVVGGMGGERTIEELLALDPAVVAVACSGYFDGGILADPARHGFRALLPKPYLRDDLSRVLVSVLAPSTPPPGGVAS